jgi:8-oxo-dGTP pyrophosphatase MutT (NUDIX family)
MHSASAPPVRSRRQAAFSIPADNPFMAPPRILDPHAVPVTGHDHHLEPVAPQRLTPDSLRAHFRAAAAFEAPIQGDGEVATGPAGGDAAGAMAAAVLVGLVQRDDGLHVLLTRRTDHLRDHAGQISFPGGRSEPEDPHPEATALREAEEEVGLPAGRVELLGRLPDYTTVTRYVVTPVVGLVHPPFDLRLDAFEVAEAFEVPLSFLMTPAHHRRHVFSMDGGQRQFLSMPWRSSAHHGEYFIWGATAAMLRNLYHFLRH